jgi:hypothetical protein
MTGKYGWSLILLLALPPQVRPEQPGTLLEEIWEAVHVEGAKVGFVHTTVRRLEGEGPKRLRAAADLDLTFKRHGALMRAHMEQGTEETEAGKVLGVFMRQWHDRGRQLVLTGALEDGRLHVRIDGGRIERRIRWSDDVVGLYRLEHLFQQRRPKAGDRFHVLRYEPTLNTVVTVRVLVKDPEEVSGTGARRPLLRVEMTPDKIEVPGARVQLPLVVWWLDGNFMPVRRQTELEGLGTLLLTRTTREEATGRRAAPAHLADIGLRTLIPLNRAISRPHATRSAVYRITLREDPDPGTALAHDGHQDVRNLRDNTLDLYVHPVRYNPRRGEKPEPPSAEFLESCPYINSDDERVKEIARRAAGAEKDPWKKARRFEGWVRQNMRPDNTAPLVPAGQVARTLRGDCRLYALLTAALCRAEGIPSRTAVGLLYVEKNQRPLLGFHMWTEVWIDGQWLGLDGTLGLGGVGATHIKIADHSWHDTHSLIPLLPVARILGKITVEVVETIR